MVVVMVLVHAACVQHATTTSLAATVHPCKTHLHHLPQRRPVPLVARLVVAAGHDQDHILLLLVHQAGHVVLPAWRLRAPAAAQLLLLLLLLLLVVVLGPLWLLLLVFLRCGVAAAAAAALATAALGTRDEGGAAGGRVAEERATGRGREQRARRRKQRLRRDACSARG